MLGASESFNKVVRLKIETEYGEKGNGERYTRRRGDVGVWKSVVIEFPSATGSWVGVPSEIKLDAF